MRFGLRVESLMLFVQIHKVGSCQQIRCIQGGGIQDVFQFVVRCLNGGLGGRDLLLQVLLLFGQVLNGLIQILLFLLAGHLRFDM